MKVETQGGAIYCSSMVERDSHPNVGERVKMEELMEMK